MDENLVITLQEHNGAGRYVARLAGADGEAQMTFHYANDRQIVVNHTGVPASMEGKGIGTALVRYAVTDARERGFTIIPHCSFVRAQAVKHPEWKDIIET